MLTRIEIDGFKTFEDFALDLAPLTAIVGPNASGKSNLFDAIRFLSRLATNDILSAMKELRGEPEEFFRRTARGATQAMRFAVEVTVDASRADDFGRTYEIQAQRLRYELTLEMSRSVTGVLRSVFVTNELCRALTRIDDAGRNLKLRGLSYGKRTTPYLERHPHENALLIRQDGPNKRGRPVQLPLNEASRTGLSTVTTAEFPHLYALRDAMAAIRFLEINPAAARSLNNRFETATLKPDASNLAAVLFHLREKTRTNKRPDGVLSDIATDLSTLIPSVSRIAVTADAQSQYSFAVQFSGEMSFSSRVISDGTLRLLALITTLNDPERRGTLCFEEPESGVHEGRIPKLVEYLRAAARDDGEPGGNPFQVIVNTHSPKVMTALRDNEIVAADVVTRIVPGDGHRVSRTRMRTGMTASADIFDPERNLVREEVERLLQHPVDAA